MNILHFFAATCGSGNQGGLVSANSLPHTCADSSTLSTILTYVFVLVGAISLLFMILGGARYALSKGEPDNVQKAKNEIKYAAIGLIIAGLAVALVNYILDQL